MKFNETNNTAKNNPYIPIELKKAIEIPDIKEKSMSAFIIASTLYFINKTRIKVAKRI